MIISTSQIRHGGTVGLSNFSKSHKQQRAELALSFVAPNHYVKFPKGLITFLFVLFEGDVISKGFGTKRL